MNDRNGSRRIYRWLIPPVCLVATLAAIVAVIKWQRYEDERVLASLQAMGGRGAIAEHKHIWIIFRGLSFSDTSLEQAMRIAEGRVADLNVACTAITDDGLRFLKNAPGLTELNLSDTQVSDEGLRHVRSLIHLRTLNLTGTQVRGPGLRYLADLPRLSHLSVMRTAVDDTALSHIGTLVELDTLLLDGSNVTGKGLPRLRALRKLRDLSVNAVPQPITREDINRLHELLPDLFYIDWDDPELKEPLDWENNGGVRAIAPAKGE